jgi:Cu-Zn family superoxide dismutase
MKRGLRLKEESIAVFAGPKVQGEAVAIAKGPDTILKVKFTKLPPGEHGFHIHRAGDLRGKGCAGACAHFHKGAHANHGPAPGTRRQRHTGDLGNVSLQRRNRRYTLKNLQPAELFGRSLIVHADRDDLGLGGHKDSHVTGNSGARIACAIFGRAMGCK